VGDPHFGRDTAAIGNSHEDRYVMLIRVHNHRRRRGALAFVAALIALAIATAWNVTRSEALTEAQRAYARVDLPGCLHHALDHLSRRPWSREAALLAARCLSRLNYADEAEPYYRRAGRLSIADQQIRAYGIVCGPHPDLAIPAYREILRVEPGNVTAMRRLAAVLLAHKEMAPLLELADRLDQTPGGAVVGAMLRGTVYHNDDNPQRAAASFERVLQLDPTLSEMPASRPLFWTQLADDLIACGRIEDAGRYINQALALGPDPQLVDRLGTTYLLRGDLDEAERCYRRAAEEGPDLYSPHLNLAKVALQRRRPDEAARELDLARQLAPKHYSVLYTLGLLYRQLGRPAEADRVQAEIQGLREAAAGAPRTPNPTWPRYAL
jgi:tetratricopeptide (TPR) repeat protein